MALSPEQAGRVVDLHQAAKRRLVRSLARAVTVVLRMLSAGVLGRAEARQQVTTLVQQSRQASADLTWSYLDLLGEAPTKGAAEVDSQGVNEWVNRILDTPVEDVEEVVAEPVESAGRAAVQQHGDAAPDVIGYRRVPHPELAEGGTCGLCVLASTRIYRRGDLEPIHDGCNCTVAEVTATSDPGDALNGIDLGEVYDDVGSTDGREAKKVRYRRGPDGRLERYADPKQRKPQPERSRPAERPRRRGRDQDQRRIAALEAEVRRLEDKQRAGQDVAFELDAARRRLRSLRRAAA